MDKIDLSLEPKQILKSKKGTWFKSLFSLLVSILMVLTVRWLLIEAYVIPSGSMLPTLLVNDHLFVNKLSYGIRLPFSSHWLVEFSGPEKGDVVVFRSVGDADFFMIKRVIGTEGDSIRYTEHGELLVNGVTVVQTQLPYTGTRTESAREFELFTEELNGVKHSLLLKKSKIRHGFEETVPKRKLFLMGDNRDRSSDSRVWGFLPVENILGKATFIWFSCDSEGFNHLAQCDPANIRWPRMFSRIL